MSTDTFTWKRRKHTAACADNIPLLHEMVRLYDDAKLSDANAAAGAGAGAAKAGGHSKMAAAYGKAIDSLAKYPLQITSAEEAEELQGVGSFLAARVGKLLVKLGVAAASPSSLPPSPVVAVGSPAPAAAAAKPPRKRKVADEAAAASPAAAAVASSSAAAASSPAAPSPSSRPIPVLPPMSSISSLSPRIPTSLASALTAVSTPTARSPAAASSSYSAAALPVCAFGALCYRTNPSHFLEQSHPPDHPMAVVMAESSDALRQPPQQLNRSKSEVIVLSEGSGSSSPPVPRAAAAASKPPPAPKRAVAQSFADGADDFMEDDHPAAADENEEDNDVVDLTSPPVPKMSRAASTPVAASSSVAAKAAAPLLPRPAALPPLHSQSISSLAPVFIPGAAAAAAAVPASKKPKVDKAYRPKANSSAFALLIGLALSKGTALTKSQVLTAAAPFFRSNADGAAAAAAVPAPDAASLTTSLWSGMANLLTRDLVDKSLTPILYSITSEGMKTAQACAPPGVLPRPSVLSSASMGDVLPDDFLSPPPTAAAAASSSSSSAAAAPSAAAPSRTPSASPSPPPAVPLRRVFVPASDFDVVLLIDVRERSGRKDSAFIAEKLTKQGMVCETRALAVGDFMWIARQKRPAGSAGAAAPCEVVLDCMIERKRVSDLVSSIRDGRYHEQRSRLKKSGLGRISYLIEGRVAEESCVGLPLSTVESVLLSMAGVHGIMVQHTPSIDASIALLAALHRVVQEEVEAEGVPIVTHEGSALSSRQPLPFGFSLPTISDSSASSSFGGCGESLSSFSSRLSKSSNLLAQELFGTQLRQIRGVSAPLAMAILDRYPCARSLVEAYEKCANRDEEEEMLQKLSRGAYQRPLGKALSLKIRTFFRSLDLDE